MDERDALAERFEAHRARLRAVAYQTLGSASEADDAVQETWLRLSRSDPGNIENLGGWLTTVVARVCLNMLQSRRDEPVGMHLPETVVSDADGVDPETEALLADSIGPALLVILPTLINGAVGVIQAAEGRPISLIAFTIIGERVVAIDLIDDPGRIAEADLAILGALTR
jgi:hypothetical protein